MDKKIISQPSTDKYREGWERVWGPKPQDSNLKLLKEILEESKTIARMIYNGEKKFYRRQLTDTGMTIAGIKVVTDPTMDKNTIELVYEPKKD